LITDFEMPDMSGAGLAAKARQINPDLPILLYTARADWRANARPGDHKLFQREIIKPAEPGALVRAVAALLPPREDKGGKGS
jgi:CheY-like chemotaxis protein